MITEDWLKEHSFKWSEDEQGVKHWVLWIGSALAERRNFGRSSSFEDFGLELSRMRAQDETWFCFFRADYAGRYSRFIYCRDVWEPEQVTKLIEALTGFPFDKECCMYGTYYRPEQAAYYRKLDAERLDRRITMNNRWHDDERDDSKAVKR